MITSVSTQGDWVLTPEIVYHMKIYKEEPNMKLTPLLIV